MRIGIFGDGAMGQQVKQLLEAAHIEATYIYREEEAENMDAIIDFSHPDFFSIVAQSIEKYRLPAVICTTGLNDAQQLKIEDLSKGAPILYTRNTSLGVAVLTHVVEETTRLLGGYDIEIIEKHHNQKVDAPSGTALQLASAVQQVRKDAVLVHGREGLVGKRSANEIGMHALRGGSIVGEHSVIFAGVDEVIELKHEAFSKKLFASGAIKAAQYLIKQEPGQYTMKDVLGIK